MAITAAQQKRIEEALCAAAVHGANSERLAEMRNTLVREFEALKQPPKEPAK
jgi:hypothetical protein